MKEKMDNHFYWADALQNLESSQVSKDFNTSTALGLISNSNRIAIYLNKTGQVQLATRGARSFLNISPHVYLTEVLPKDEAKELCSQLWLVRQSGEPSTFFQFWPIKSDSTNCRYLEITLSVSYNNSSEQYLLEAVDITELLNLRNEQDSDFLTGAKSKKYFENRLRSEIALANRKNTPLTLLFADVDNFKLLNDTQGHPQGDIALQDIMKLITSQSREYEPPCRLGGDELAIVLLQTVAEAKVFAERLRQSIESADGVMKILTMSIGLSGLSPGLSCEKLIERADEALYASKVTKNAVTVYEEKILRG